jgi:hypothetical protein
MEFEDYKLQICSFEHSNFQTKVSKTPISVAFNDRCDMIVATVVLPHDQPAMIEPSVMEFLNSGTVLRWAEITLGT